MNPNRSNTALLLFLRSVQEEAEVKQFSYARGFRNNLKVISLLNRRLKKSAQKSGLPTFVIPGKQQEGQSFGERLANAIQSIFDKGYDKVCAVGNDCLDLDASFFSSLPAKMENTDLLLGPDNRGGAYLIGISKKAFDKERFIKLDWQTNQLIGTFRDYGLNLQIKFDLLPFKQDINNAQDLWSAIHDLPRLLNLRRLFLILLEKLERSTAHRSCQLLIFLFHFDFQLRGPPPKLQ